MRVATRKAREEVREMSQEFYPINSNSMRADIQAGLYQDVPEVSIVPFSGYCFELLSQLIFGNSHHNGGIFELEYDGPTFQPDLFNETGDLMETKSCNERMQLKLFRRQMAGYASYAIKNPDKKIDFTFFSHSIDRMVSRKLSRKQYVEEFAESVGFSIKTPFALPIQFYLKDKFDTQAGERFRCNEYGRTNLKRRGYCGTTISSFSSTLLRELLKEPEDVTKALDLNPDDFEFERYTVDDTTVNNIPIQPFPLLIISPRVRGKWIEESKKKLEDLVKNSNAAEVALSRMPEERVPKEESILDTHFDWEQGKYVVTADEKPLF